MIYLNEDIKNRIKALNYDNVYVVADFDRTITALDSCHSWNLLQRNNFMCDEKHTKEAKALYDYYRPLEIDYSIDLITKDKLMHDWWEKEISLLVKYGLTENMVNNVTSNIDLMHFREGGKDFLIKMHKKNIPVIIISAGLGNFIEQFLKCNDCMFDNIYLIANFIKFENGIAVGIKSNIIHSFNKNIISLNEPIENAIRNRKDILLLGDNLADINMVPDEKRDNTIRIGFVDYNVEENFDKFRKEFDIVCTNNTSFSELEKTLKYK